MKISASFTALFTALLLTLVAPAHAAAIPVFNGDFEQPSPSAPPPGWVMWGNEQWKVPSHYIRDTDQPHAGQACFRILHPKGTQGYIVADPDHAFQPHPHMAYTITFFARASQNGSARFSLTAYQSLKTYADAPSPGSWTFPVTADWQRYTFTIHEGLEFFADEARFVLLTFHAAASDDITQTLWLDDITLDESPNPADTVQLINPATFPSAPPVAPLAAGPTLAVTIDPARILRPVNPLLGGLSFHRLDGYTGYPFDKHARYTLPDETAAATASPSSLPVTVRDHAVTLDLPPRAVVFLNIDLAP